MFRNNDDFRENNDFFDCDEEFEEFAERDNRRRDEDNSEKCRKQTHTHEYLGSVKIAERQEDPHNHRFAGVTGEAIRLPGGNHYHKLEGNTDFYEDHFHIVKDKTGPAICVGDGRHVHFVSGETTVNDGHRHDFEFATLINNPIGD